MIDLEDHADLHALMTRATADLTAPAGTHARAVERGATLRRRRRARHAVAGLAAGAAVVAVLVSWSASGHQRETADDLGVASQPNTTPVDNGAGIWQMPAREMLHRLRPLLPDVVSVREAPLTSTDHAPDESDRLVGHLVVTLSRAGAAGEGKAEVMLIPAPDENTQSRTTGTRRDGTGAAEARTVSPAVESMLSCPPAGLGAAVVVLDCTELSDATGTHIGRVLTLTFGALTMHESYVATGSGALVYVASANTVDEKWGSDSPASSERPMLSADEVRAIAESSTWTDWEPPTD